MGSLSDFFGVVPDNCEVRFIDEQHGNGIFVKQAYNVGDVIFYEKPLVQFQQSYNRQEAWTCAHCCRFLSTLDKQFAKHLGLTRLHIPSAIHLPGSEQPPYFDQQNPCEPVSCIAGCGEEYCSEACREAAFVRYHHLLCVGQISSTKHPLYRFKQHALTTNELFLLAGQFIARVISLWLENGKQAGIPAFQTQFLSKFTHRFWWDMFHDDASPEELQRLAQESLTLLQQAFSAPFAENKSDLEQLSSLFNFEFYSKLLALLETNEIAIGIVSPLEEYRKNLDKLNEGDKAVAEKLLTPVMTKLKQLQDAACGEPADEEGDHDMDDATAQAAGAPEPDIEAEEESEDEGEEEEDNDEVPIFSNYEGIGVFPFTAMMNHSCEPNCQVNFDKDSTLKITVLKPIQVGEQLLQSYIYESASLKERTLELKPYGFACDCPKCVRQIAEQQQNQAKGKKKNKQKI